MRYQRVLYALGSSDADVGGGSEAKGLARGCFRLQVTGYIILSPTITSVTTITSVSHILVSVTTAIFELRPAIR